MNYSKLTLSISLSLGMLFLSACEDINNALNIPEDITAKTVIDFEDGAEYLAGPSFYGENYYANFDAEAQGAEKFKQINKGFTLTKDDVTFHFPINDGANFYSGGTAISYYNYMGKGHAEKRKDWYDWKNQMSVYNTASSDSTNQKAGAGASQYFGVVFTSTDKPAKISLTDQNGTPAERKILSLQICPTSYFYGVATYGNSFSKSLKDSGWFAVDVKGFDTQGKPTAGGKPVRIYLTQQDFHPGSVLFSTWKEFDLSALGSVSTLSFSCLGSDTGQYGLNTPAYFAIDNITFEKK